MNGSPVTGSRGTCTPAMKRGISTRVLACGIREREHSAVTAGDISSGALDRSAWPLSLKDLCTIVHTIGKACAWRDLWRFGDLGWRRDSRTKNLPSGLLLCVVCKVLRETGANARFSSPGRSSHHGQVHHDSIVFLHRRTDSRAIRSFAGSVCTFGQK